MTMNNSNFFEFVVERNTFAQQLNEYRKKGEYTDVKLQLGDNLFPANRNVLASSSPVLKALISDQWSTANICQLSEEYVDTEIMEGLLSFLYTGKIKLTPENVHPVCIAAHFLQIPELFEASVKYLCQLITVENVLILFKFSITCDIEELNYSCLRFVNNNHEGVFQNSDVLELSSKDFEDLIVGLKKFWAKKLRENTFQCIVRWTEINLIERLDHLPILLKNIPLEELPLEFLNETVSTDPLVKNSNLCMETVSNALANYQTYSNPALETTQNMVIVGGQKEGEFGAQPSKFMILYDSRTGVWKDLPDLRPYRSAFGVTVVNQQDIIICGGYVDEHPRQVTDSVVMFEWITQTWIELPSMPVACVYLSMAACNGNLYVIGRFNCRTESSTYSKSVLCYSFEKEQWTYVASMKKRRCGGKLIAYQNHLYALGGNHSDNRNETSTLEKYDPAQNKWTVMANIPDVQNVDIGTATIHQGKFYACGYKDFLFENIIFIVYDPETNVWSSLPAPPHENGTSLASMNGRLLLSGGYSDHRKSDLIYEFDISTQEWIEFGKLNSGIIHHSTLAGPFY